MELSKLTLACIACLAPLFVNNVAMAATPAEEVRDIRSDFMEEAMDARADYRKQLQRHARTAVGKFEKAAANAVREGDLAAATEAMKQVLWLDRDNAKAIAHFKAIGQLDEVLKELEEQPDLPEADDVNTSKLGRMLVGTTWSWGEGQTLTFLPGGIAHASNDKKPNSRVWQVDANGNVYVASTAPSKYLTIVRFDPEVKSFSGQGYTLSQPKHTGSRVR